MIGIFYTYPPCDLNGILQVTNKWKPTSSALGGNTQNLDAVVDRKFPDDLYSTSIFSSPDLSRSGEKDSQNVTAYTFSHTSNTQRDDSNVILTSKKLDKSDELADAVKDLTINDAKYYESNTAAASDAQGELTYNL